MQGGREGSASPVALRAPDRAGRLGWEPAGTPSWTRGAGEPHRGVCPVRVPLQRCAGLTRTPCPTGWGVHSGQCGMCPACVSWELSARRVEALGRELSCTGATSTARTGPGPSNAPAAHTCSPRQAPLLHPDTVSSSPHARPAPQGFSRLSQAPLQQGLFNTVPLQRLALAAQK